MCRFQLSDRLLRIFFAERRGKFRKRPLQIHDVITGEIWRESGIVGQRFAPGRAANTLQHVEGRDHKRVMGRDESREIRSRSAVGKQVRQPVGTGFNHDTSIFLRTDMDDREFASLVRRVNQGFERFLVERHT